MGFLDRFRRRGLPPARVASTQPLSVLQSRTYRRFRQTRQERAVFFARRLGLIRFANGLVADSAARVLIRPERQARAGDDRSWEPVDSALHGEILHRFRNETEELPDLVRLLVWHDGVTGECLQVTDVDDDGRPQFRIRSALQAEYTSRGVLIREMSGGGVHDGTAKWIDPHHVRRVWTPDEEEPLLATSPTLGVLEDVERYWALHRATKRRAESALASNGILWTPDGAHNDLPRGQTAPGGPQTPGSKLEQDYYTVAKRSLEDDDDIAAFVPLMMKWAHTLGPPEYIEFPNVLDPNGILYRTEAVEDIARGLNYPARLLVTGTGDGNHWSDWLMDEQFARTTIAPVLERALWRNLTNSYYRPALRALAARGLFDDEPGRYRIGFDMTPIIVHPDASARAVELYKLAAVGLDTMLEANGFDPTTDVPSESELARWLKVQEVLTRASTQPLPGAGPSNVREGVPVGAAVAALAARNAGPFAGELVGWLDA